MLHCFCNSRRVRTLTVPVNCWFWEPQILPASQRLFLPSLLTPPFFILCRHVLSAYAFSSFSPSFSATHFQNLESKAYNSTYLYLQHMTLTMNRLKSNYMSLGYYDSIIYKKTKSPSLTWIQPRVIKLWLSWYRISSSSFSISQLSWPPLCWGMNKLVILNVPCA